jgi:hypothetical protein
MSADDIHNLDYVQTPKNFNHLGQDDRVLLTGILFVLQSGIPRETLPQEMGCSSDMSRWRRLRD